MFELERPTPVMRKALSALSTSDILSLAISLEGMSVKELNAPFFLSKRTIPTTLMMEAAKHGDGEVIEFLASRGVKASRGVSVRRNPLVFWLSKKTYPLDKACNREDGASAVRSLLRAGALPTISALDRATHQKAWDAVEEMLQDERLDLPYIFSKEGKSICIILCAWEKFGRSDLVLRALDAGIPVYKLRNKGATLLCNACSSGNIDIITKLIDVGVDTNRRGLNRVTPLVVATLNGHFDVVQRLCEHNVNPFSAHPGGYTAKKVAKDPAIAKYLESYEQQWRREKK